MRVAFGAFVLVFVVLAAIGLVVVNLNDQE